MSIQALSPTISDTATTLVHFNGPADVEVVWSVESGPGTITGLTAYTDGQGSAWAVYDPGGVTGTTVLRATHGT